MHFQLGKNPIKKVKTKKFSIVIERKMSSVDKSLKPAVEYGDLVTKLIHVMACDVS